MKRFMTLVATLLSSSFLLVAPVHADSSFWSLQQDALTKQTSGTFNVGYTVLSTSQHDFVVSLYEDGSSSAVGSQHTQVAGDSNTNFGNSGKFAISLPNGNHTLTLTAVRDDADTKTVSSTVTVDTTQPAPTVVTTTRVVASTNPTNPAPATTTSGLAAANLADGSLTSGSTTQGEVNAPGATHTGTTSKANNGKVLGAKTTKPDNNRTAAWTGAILAVAVVILAYYALAMRRRRQS